MYDTPTIRMNDTVTQAYSDPTLVYDIRGFFILTFAYNDTLWRQVRFLANNMRAEHADIAVGSGTLLSIILLYRKLTHMAPVHIEASDYVDSMLESAKRRFRKNTHVTCRHADATQLPYADQSFDSLNIANSLHCISNIDAALHEMYRVLKPGGTWASNTLLYPQGNGILARIANRINAWGMRKGILHTPYEMDTIRQKVLAAGFVIDSESRHGNAYYVLAHRP